MDEYLTGALNRSTDDERRLSEEPLLLVGLGGCLWRERHQPQEAEAQLLPRCVCVHVIREPTADVWKNIARALAGVALMTEVGQYIGKT